MVYSLLCYWGTALILVLFHAALIKGSMLWPVYLVSSHHVGFLHNHLKDLKAEGTETL